MPGRRKAASRLTPRAVWRGSATGKRTDCPIRPKLFRRRLVGLLAGARPGIEELTPIMTRNILGDAVIFGPAVLGQEEGAEELSIQGKWIAKLTSNASRSSTWCKW